MTNSVSESIIQNETLLCCHLVHRNSKFNVYFYLLKLETRENFLYELYQISFSP